MKRIPFYLLVDTSGSMDEDRIEAVKDGLRRMKDMVGEDPWMQDRAFISLIEFNDNAHVVVPMTSIYQFQVPNFSAQGCASFVAALNTLADCYKQDIVLRGKDNQDDADYRPILVVFTAGEHTDTPSALRGAVEQFQTNLKDKFTARICCYVGGGASESERNRANAILEQITGKCKDGDETGIVINVADGYDTIVKFFKCVSQSVGRENLKLPMIYQHFRELINLEEK